VFKREKPFRIQTNLVLGKGVDNQSVRSEGNNSWGVVQLKDPRTRTYPGDRRILYTQQETRN